MPIPSHTDVFKKSLEADILKRHAHDIALDLNLLPREADWKDALRESLQKLRPDGTLIFNVHSRDHAAVHDDLQCGTDELLAFADEARLTITHFIPYGAFLGEPGSNRFLHPELESKHKWNRLLSWFERDQALFDFGLFLEHAFIAHLTPGVCGQMFVVLKNQPAQAANRKIREDLAARNAALAQHDFKALLPWLPLALEQYASELNRHLQPLRNRVFFYWLFRSLMLRLPDFNLRDVIAPDMLAQFNLWRQHEQTDAQALNIVRTWAKDADFRFKDGVDVTLWSQYNMIKTMLAEYFGAFRKEAP
jgi:hypothetical protein